MKPSKFDSHPVARDLARFIRSWGTVGDFNDLALRLFAYHYENNAPYRRFCESRKAAPGAVEQWDQIPAAPAAAFRTQVLSCTTIEPAALFYTSGTTGAAEAVPGMEEAAGRGVHIMDPTALDLYELSLLTTFRRLAARAAGLPIRSLIAPYEQARHSSLSYMVSVLAAKGASGHQFFWSGDGPDIEEAQRCLAQNTGPVLLFTTAFALLEFLEILKTPLSLHPESILIETGGFKGRRQAVERDDLYAMAADRLTLPLQNIGSEYGMCEMASQFYDRHLSVLSPGLPVKMGPPWVRTVFVDPVSGAPAHTGEAGLLRHYDLCNFNSVLAITTADIGLPAENGEGFILQGRLSGAPPRGCSLTVEEWNERRR